MELRASLLVGLALIQVACGPEVAAPTDAPGPSDAPFFSEASAVIDAPTVGTDAPGSDAGPTVCTAGAVEEQPAFADGRLPEVSGIVVSRRDPGVRYVHNDSGETNARFFAVLEDGSTLAEIIVDDAPAPRDWEDVAIETTSDGREILTFGDTGDNAARDGSGTPRTSVRVIRVEPPTLPTSPAAAALHVDALAVVTLTYPDAPHDCEAIFVDGVTGDLYLITKENAGPAGLYRATAPLVDGETRALERLVDVFPTEGLITAADADDRFVVVRNYGRSWLYVRNGRSVADTLVGMGLRLPMVSEPQGEAIALEDGGVLFASEMAGAELHFVPFTCVP